MKKLIPILLIILLIPAISIAATVTITVDKANIRSGPGTGYEIKANVYKGERYELLRQSGNW